MQKKWTSWSQLKNSHNCLCVGTGAYQLGNTSSRMIVEVKQHCVWFVLCWKTLVQEFTGHCREPEFDLLLAFQG